MSLGIIESLGEIIQDLQLFGWIGIIESSGVKIRGCRINAAEPFNENSFEQVAVSRTGSGSKLSRSVQKTGKIIHQVNSGCSVCRTTQTRPVSGSSRSCSCIHELKSRLDSCSCAVLLPKALRRCRKMFEMAGKLTFTGQQKGDWHILQS